MSGPQKFWLGLFLAGAGLMIVHSVLSISGLDTDLQPLEGV